MTLRGLEATFLPGEPPRAGQLALWRATGTTGRTDRSAPPGRTTRTGGATPLATDPPPAATAQPGDGWSVRFDDVPFDDAVRTMLTVLVPDRTGRPRRRRVEAYVLPIDRTLALLPALIADGHQHLTASLQAWSYALLGGLRVISRGRLRPVASGSGQLTVRAGPLDPDDAEWLRRLAEAFPTTGYAVPAGARGSALTAPGVLIRSAWDALADALASGDGPPAAAAPVGRWLADVDRELRTAVRLVLRIVAPEATAVPGDADGAFAVVPQLRAVADPGLVLDVDQLWQASDDVLARFGTEVEQDLLIALRRAARVFPPLAGALAGQTPGRLPLTDDDLDVLLGAGTGELTAAGVEVLWPAELLRQGPTLTAGTRRPAAVAAAGLTMDEVLDFQWQATVDGQRLSDAEVDALAEAKRPLVRMRGRWIRLDPGQLRRLRSRRGRLDAVRALAAALTGTLDVAGETVEFRPDPALAAAAETLRRTGSAVTEAVEPPGLAATLRPYQRRGLAWLAGMCDSGLGGCLADDMGLGKTIQIIALHLHRGPLRHGPTLVVCPTSLLGNWARELDRFAPRVPVRRYAGPGHDLSDVDCSGVVLVSYGMLRRHTAALAGLRWGLVVADEAQQIKNPLSATAHSLRAVPAVARLALTGTPVENRLSDLWSILDWTTPGLLGTRAEFRARIAVPVERYADPDATERFGRLVRPFLLRRRKIDPGIVPELPAKTETDRLVPLSTEQATLYQAVVAETMADIETAEGIGRRGLVLKLLTALKQICNHPAQYLGQSEPLAGRSGKLTALDGLLDVILAEGESVLVFSQYVGLCRLLERHLSSRGVPTLLVHGGVPEKTRQARVAEFQAGTVPVFLLSLKAAGTGLNLTRASHVVHYDRWWNPAVEDQATDRAHRIGQERPVQVHRLVAEHTVEDRIARLIADKRRLADAVTGAGERWLTELSDTELADLVTLGSGGTGGSDD